MKSNVGLMLLMPAVVLLSGCVHQISDSQAAGLNNYLLMDCAEGGEINYGNWPMQRTYGDRAGVCSSEVSRRVANAQMGQTEALIDAQRVHREMILGY